AVAHAIKVIALLLAVFLACTGRQGNSGEDVIDRPFTVNGARVDPDSLNAYLAAHRGFTSRGGEMRCAYAPLGQQDNRVFVWALCTELLAIEGHLVNGSGMSLPAAFHIAVDSGRARITNVEVPQDGSGYGSSIRRIFPASTWPAIFSGGTRDGPGAGLEHHLRLEAAARFGLPPAAADAPRRHDPEPIFTIDSGSFVRVVRGDTVLVDEFVRTSNSLEGVVRTRTRNAKFGWARYRVELSRSGEATRSQLSLGRVGTTPDSAASYTATFGPDSIIEEWPNRAPTRIPYVRGTVPLFGPSVAMLQEVIRRGMRIAPALREAGVPVYFLLSRGRIDRLRVQWIARDTVTVASGDGVAERYAVDGWKIVGGQDGDHVTARRRAIASAARLDSAARRVVDFLRGKAGFEQIEFADSVTLYVAPEGGGAHATFSKEQLRQPSAWRVRSQGHVFSLAPPPAVTKLTTKVGRHLNCGEQSLAAKFPRLARLPHVGATLAPENMGSCLQTWNMTFVFDTDVRPRLVAVAYDQYEW
ncbi:MAG: hypothetical protein ACJ8AJ_04305, partial [Gemmatimonadaceae bacterium]